MKNKIRLSSLVAVKGSGHHVHCACNVPGRYGEQGAIGTDGKLYTAGGMLADNSPVPNFQRYNPTADAWESLPSLLVPVGQAALAAANGKVYVAGGFTGGTSVTSTLQIFDIGTNSWSFGPSMITSREAGAGVALGNYFYVMGGDDFNAPLSSVEVLNLMSQTWSLAAPIPATRTNVYAATTGGLIYLFGGATSASYTAVDTLFSYNPASNSWLQLAPANTGGKGNYAGISPFGPGLLLATDGGTTTFTPSNTTHIYNIGTDSWTIGPTMNIARLGHAQATLPNGSVVVASGLGSISPQAVTTAVELIASTSSCSTPSSTPTYTVTPTGNSTPTSILVGHVVWQGRPAQPNSLQQLPITLTLKSGSIEVNYASQNTNASGSLTVSVGSLPNGTYNWRVKGPKYLANSGTVSLTGSQVTNAEMGLMIAGDANNDNLITVLDFNILKNTFGRSAGDPGYDDRADFTGDQVVTILDFNLLKINFGQGGAPPIGPGQTNRQRR